MMSRFFGADMAIHVVCDHDQMPLAFVWNQQRHDIIGIANRWRIHTQWWLMPIHRDYFKVYTQQLLAEIFLDLENNYWYLQRIYD